MAIKAAVRIKPDTYRSSLSTTIQNFDPAAAPPTGQVVMVAQAIVYDDAVLTGTNYQPGDPVTERNIVVLYEEVITKELAVFNSLTQAQATAEWTAALNEFMTRILPAGPTLVKAIRSARLAAPVPVAPNV